MTPSDMGGVFSFVKEAKKGISHSAECGEILFTREKYPKPPTHVSGLLDVPTRAVEALFLLNPIYSKFFLHSH